MSCYKIKTNIHFQYITAQSKHYCQKAIMRAQNNNVKVKSRLGAPCLASEDHDITDWVPKGLTSLIAPGLLPISHLDSFGLASFYCMQLSSEDISWLWHLQNPLFSTTIQASLSEPHKMTSQRLSMWIPTLSHIVIISFSS